MYECMYVCSWFVSWRRRWISWEGWSRRRVWRQRWLLMVRYKYLIHVNTSIPAARVYVLYRFPPYIWWFPPMPPFMFINSLRSWRVEAGRWRGRISPVGHGGADHSRRETQGGREADCRTQRDLGRQAQENRSHSEREVLHSRVFFVMWPRFEDIHMHWYSHPFVCVVP